MELYHSNCGDAVTLAIVTSDPCNPALKRNL